MSFVDDVLNKVMGPVVRGTLRWRWSKRVGEQVELIAYTEHRQEMALYNCALAALVDVSNDERVDDDNSVSNGLGVKERAMEISGMKLKIAEQETRCSACRSDNVGVVARQTRSADEGMTAKLVCNDCGAVRHL